MYTHPDTVFTYCTSSIVGQKMAGGTTLEDGLVLFTGLRSCTISINSILQNHRTVHSRFCQSPTPPYIITIITPFHCLYVIQYVFISLLIITGADKIHWVEKKLISIKCFWIISIKKNCHLDVTEHSPV